MTYRFQFHETPEYSLADEANLELRTHNGQECVVIDTWNEPDYDHQQPTHTVRFTDGSLVDIADNELIGEPRPLLQR